MISRNPTLATFVLSLVMGLGPAADGAMVTFVLSESDSGIVGEEDGTALEVSGTASRTAGGITLTLTAASSVAGGTGSLNQNAGNFGVNANGNGDVIDAIDGGEGAESIEFSITSSVPLSSLLLRSIDFDRVTGAGTIGAPDLADRPDQGQLDIAGVGLTSFLDTNVSSSDLLNVNQSLSVTGQTFTIRWIEGNGFGLERLTFDATAVAVPEPSTLCVFGLLSTFGLMRRRRWNRG